MANRLLRVVFDADLRCSHDGLMKIAANLRINLLKLESGEFVAFINSKRTMIKLYAANNIIAHYKSTRRIDMSVLAHIPRYFNGSVLRYDDALKAMLEQKLGKVKG